MGKATPFEGELDAFGNPCCGQSFMGGTICSDAPGHGGGCSAMCQNCHGDHVNGTCTCYDECVRCDDWFVPERDNQNGTSGTRHCEHCLNELRAIPSSLELRQEDFASHQEEWCDTKFAIWNDVFDCRRFKDHDGPHGCGGAISRKYILQSRPLTDAELAEVHRSLLGTM